MSEHIRIVIIEDHNLSRVGLSAVLQQVDDFEVVGEAASGQQGLCLLSAIRPDIAIIEIGLPELDGIELIRAYHAQQLCLGDLSGVTKMRFLVLTMNQRADIVLAAFAAGADSYSLKDTSLDNLINAIRITNQGNVWLDPKIARIILQQAYEIREAKQAYLISISEANRIRNANREKLAPLSSVIEQPGGRTVEIAALKAEYQEVINAYPLTERELEVLQLIVAGYSNKKIAQQLHVTSGTIKTHVRNILVKLCASDRTQAAVHGLRSGIVP